MSIDTKSRNGSNKHGRRRAASVDVQAVLLAARRARADYLADRTGKTVAALGRGISRLLHIHPGSHRPAAG